MSEQEKLEGVRIFLDDVRKPEMCLSYMHRRIGKLSPIYGEKWTIVRNYEDFVKAVEKNFPDISHISFDHDLAIDHYDPTMLDLAGDAYNKLYDTFSERTGYDAALWLKAFYKARNEPLPVLFVHSLNPVGTRNIINVFK
jgi:hypothetical protein